MGLKEQEEYSQSHVESFSLQVEKLCGDIPAPHPAIYLTGSFGRLEGNKESDLDLFFFTESSKTHLNINGILFKNALINKCRELGFPEFSKDGGFLEYIPSD